ncbi:insulinase family protein [Pedobacter sp. ASV12]|uniref:insulinase family protein n=1 Tax=Pedobacter sp. ASV12 TaxID=2795120 RepID=UPI0018EDE2AE|nr:insulinase family protein [Pedobacter sp. ASV12]
MKFTTKITFIILSLFFFNAAFAQNPKAPVSFKLKNGVTVIVAQNAGMGKIYSRLTIENQNATEQKNVAQVFESFLNKRANAFQGSTNSEGIAPKVSLSVDEANTATNVADFQQALQFVSDHLTNTTLSEQAFEHLKAQLKDRDDLANVSLADVKAFYANHFAPAQTFITIAGDIDVSTAKAMANKAFGDWKAQTAAL